MSGSTILILVNGQAIGSPSEEVEISVGWNEEGMEPGKVPFNLTFPSLPILEINKLFMVKR